MAMQSHTAIDAETRRQLLDGLDRFIRTSLAPRAAEIDDSGEFPRDLYRQVADLGILGLWIPSEYGGCGPDLVAPLLVSERLAKANVAFSITVSNTGDCVAPIVRGGSEWARKTYLPAVAGGQLIPSFCLSEPSGGSDVAGMKSVAVRDKGINVWPQALEDLVFAHEAVDEYEVVLTTEKGVGDVATLRLMCTPEVDGPKRSQLCAEMTKAVRAKLGVGFAVEVVEPGAIGRSEYKARRWIDRREHVQS